MDLDNPLHTATLPHTLHKSTLLIITLIWRSIKRRIPGITLEVPWHHKEWGERKVNVLPLEERGFSFFLFSCDLLKEDLRFCVSLGSQHLLLKFHLFAFFVKFEARLVLVLSVWCSLYPVPDLPLITWVAILLLELHTLYIVYYTITDTYQKVSILLSKQKSETRVFLGSSWNTCIFWDLHSILVFFPFVVCM